ncbi:DUF2231 domain-containing protein [Marinilabilia sp.]|uniref:DUF2231 domain-containing protein n=1 Tax=Marinilabilia sp. TaxID=2021252 RepID=UPI0025BE1E84|nr:DUF2231 domain-containing protein [Marinilabilia sp.]
MAQIPDFWRTEIWHPLTVHFPIALLAFATIFLIVGYWFRKAHPTFTGQILLVAGTIGAWITVYTGGLADGVVSRQICDPTVLKAHENGAFTVAWLFSAASALAIIEYFGLFRKFRNLLIIGIIGLSVTGTGFLIYTGHLGATLVYQQAAGVYTPSEDCIEFTETD